MGLIDYIDTRKATINALKDWNDKHFILENAPKQLREIEARIHTVKSMSTDSTPVQGGANKVEENLCKAIDRKDVIKQGKRRAQEYVHEMDFAWSRLTEEERYYLKCRFVDYINGNGIQRIMDEKHIERSEAYRRSDDALDRLRKLLYW